MSTEPIQFDPMDPEEIVPLSFEFADLTTGPTSPVITITRHSGNADVRDLTAMLVGTAQIIGTQIRQKVTAPLNGTNYSVRCRVDTPEGYRFAEAAILPGQSV